MLNDTLLNGMISTLVYFVDKTQQELKHGNTLSVVKSLKAIKNHLITIQSILDNEIRKYEQENENE
ncbi:hypothetical protein [Mannheimia haemolytica]|uniref:hypothetical protein n=1 Tax=Mannheimia haemolytica TaxID=75985 RepID=UPI000385593C|nr:hypothetical protein [Mannheimia haemolytica]EPY99249.1 hypothetical protein L278_10740 [Mannheimia haemolytica D35]TRC50588.1 hypothetical protein FEA40_01110 [Mannheimia haemolytica]TRC50886.1 hypothetical protein FEA32_01110 [Mannheimia haemolytica]